MEVDRSIVLSQTIVSNSQIAEVLCFCLSSADRLVDGEGLLMEVDRSIVLSQTIVSTAQIAEAVGFTGTIAYLQFNS